MDFLLNTREKNVSLFELKMCEKYIDIAESKNDMKALKQLLTIQKNLKRQEQRIRYKMKVDFNQNVPKTDD